MNAPVRQKLEKTVGRRLVVNRMRALYRKLCAQEAFQPGWLAIFINSVFLFRRILHHTMKRHASSLGGTVVDFGCGRKPYRDLVPADCYVGLDLPVSGHPDSEKKADVFFDGLRLPLRDESVDAVIASEVFEHVFDLPRTLREIRRVLKPGGRILVTCPFCWNEHETPYDFARYTQFALAELFKNAGFRIVIQEKAGSYTYALTQMALVYCIAHLRPQRGAISALLGIFYNTIFNSLGLLLERSAPVRWDFYLSNVVIAEKEPAPLP